MCLKSIDSPHLSSLDKQVSDRLWRQNVFPFVFDERRLFGLSSNTSTRSLTRVSLLYFRDLWLTLALSQVAKGVQLSPPRLWLQGKTPHSPCFGHRIKDNRRHGVEILWFYGDMVCFATALWNIQNFCDKDVWGGESLSTWNYVLHNCMRGLRKH